MDGHVCPAGVTCPRCGNISKDRKTITRQARHNLKAQDKKDYENEQE